MKCTFMLSLKLQSDTSDNFRPFLQLSDQTSICADKVSEPVENYDDKNNIPYSGLFSRGKIFTNAQCGNISGVKFSRMVNKGLISNHTPIYFQGENIREWRSIREIHENFPPRK